MAGSKRTSLIGWPVEKVFDFATRLSDLSVSRT